jgi:hypothetical protein
MDAFHVSFHGGHFYFNKETSPMKDKIVRVATNNNFNCTKPEWNQLDAISAQHPEKYFFINSNIRTPKLNTVTQHDYKVVVTVNPDLLITQSGINKILSRLNAISSRIAFVRLKYIPENNMIKLLLTRLILRNIPVVITMQRFNGKKTLLKYTSLKHYTHSCSRYRLSGEALTELLSVVKIFQAAHKPVWICDQAGLGCQVCGLCSKLTTGSIGKIYSLNLSSSGICPYNCPDCYAKTMQNFCTKLGYKPIVFNKIQQNEKQTGKTAHIKENQKKVSQ